MFAPMPRKTRKSTSLVPVRGQYIEDGTATHVSNINHSIWHSRTHPSGFTSRLPTLNRLVPVHVDTRIHHDSAQASIEGTNVTRGSLAPTTARCLKGLLTRLIGLLNFRGNCRWNVDSGKCMVDRRVIGTLSYSG